MFKVPSIGPGCAHFMTCSTCLMAPHFMNCGWCSGICLRQHECTSKWNKTSCAPVITEVDLLLGVTDANATKLHTINQRLYWDTDCYSVFESISLQFFPKTAPAGSETMLTLCGWEFQSPLRPAIISGKTHIITVGSGTLCTVLPEKSNSQV